MVRLPDTGRSVTAQLSSKNAMINGQRPGKTAMGYCSLETGVSQTSLSMLPLNFQGNLWSKCACNEPSARYFISLVAGDSNAFNPIAGLGLSARSSLVLDVSTGNVTLMLSKIVLV